MKIIRNNILPFSGYKAVNLFGLLFVRKNAVLSPQLINHEEIHIAQMREMLYIFFYIWYVLEWLIRLICYWNNDLAYHNVGFEKEAFIQQGDTDYLKSRKLFAWISYI